MSDFAQPSDGRRLTFNEFQRSLKNKGIEGPVAYFLTMLYEQVGELSKQNDDMAKMLLEYAKIMEGFANLRTADQHLLKSMQNRVFGQGMVRSETVLDDLTKKN